MVGKSHIGAMLAVIALLLLVAGAVVERAMVDTSRAATVLADPRIGGVTLGDDGTLADAWSRAQQLDVRWSGDRPTVTPAPGSAAFRGEPGRRAVARVERLLHDAASEPGGAPRIDEIAFTTSGASAIAQHAVSRIRTFDRQWAPAARREVRAASVGPLGSAYYGTLRRIVLAPDVSATALRVLRAPAGTAITRDDAFHVKVLRHEIEHGMSTGKGSADWLEEAAAEVLPQWAGRGERAMRRVGLDLDYERPMYTIDYEDWAALLGSMLSACHMPPDDPAAFDEAATLLRSPERPIQDALGRCLAAEAAGEGSTRDLASLVARAGSSREARRELARVANVQIPDA